jgi:hypothetical protein
MHITDPIIIIPLFSLAINKTKDNRVGKEIEETNSKMESYFKFLF